MLLTATPTPATTTMSFPAFVEEAMSRGRSVRSQKEHALDLGVDEAALIRYANGAVSAYERTEIQNVIANCDWAREIVINQVKNKRRHRNAA
jgi:hypothetical protein